MAKVKAKCRMCGKEFETIHQENRSYCSVLCRFYETDLDDVTCEHTYVKFLCVYCNKDQPNED